MSADFSSMFKDIRKSMGIKETLFIREGGDYTSSIGIDLSYLDAFEAEIKLSQLDPEQSDRILRIAKANVYMYVNDNRLNGRYHIAWCSTLRGAYKEKKAGQFVISRRLDKIDDRDICKNCLSALNFEGYRNAPHLERNRIWNEFDLSKFMTTEPERHYIQQTS